MIDKILAGLLAKDLNIIQITFFGIISTSTTISYKGKEKPVYSKKKVLHY